MKFLKSFVLFENQKIKNSDEILTINGKKVDISHLSKDNQQDIFDIISEFDNTLPEEELFKTIELYILSVS